MELPVLGTEQGSPLGPVLGLSSLLMVTFPVLTQPGARQAMRSFLQAALLGREHTVEMELSGSPLAGLLFEWLQFLGQTLENLTWLIHILSALLKKTLGPKQVLTGNHLPVLASQMLRLWG